jgi:hypothetical protein
MKLMKSKASLLLYSIIISLLGVLLLDFYTLRISLAQDSNKKLKDLRLIVKFFREEDAEFFNKVLTKDDIVFTYGAKVRLLTKIRGPKLMIGRHSIADIKEAIKRLKDIHVDYINYNPEQWRSSRTPREEIDDLPEAVRKVRRLAEQKNAGLSFATDHVLLERYGERIAAMVDLFGIQMQRYQTETLEEFRKEALKKASIVRRGSKNVPIIFQLSLAPPKWKIITKPNGERKKVLVRGKGGEKLLEPLKAEVVLEQIKTIKDIADGIALIYTEDTRDEMKRLILLLRQMSIST